MICYRCIPRSATRVDRAMLTDTQAAKICHTFDERIGMCFRFVY